MVAASNARHRDHGPNVSGYLAAALRLEAVLTDAGIRATLEPRSLNPPAVLIVPQRADPTTRGRTAHTTDLIAWAPAAMSAATLQVLDQLATQIRDALTAAGIPWDSAEWLARPNPLTGDDQLTLTIAVQTTED